MGVDSDDIKGMDAMDPAQKQAAREAERAARGSMLRRFDGWMHEHPWHPRAVPFAAYVALLWLSIPAKTWAPITYPVIYTAQCLIVAAIIWRYRRLTPEINWKFHWLAVPVAVAAVAAWIALGLAMAALWPGWLGQPGDNVLEQMGPALGWTSLIVHLLGMSIVVPMLEEVLFRSALLRSLYRPRAAGAALIDLASDLPGIGDRIAASRAGRWAAQWPRPMASEFESVPLGQLSVFSILATCAIWCGLSHHPRDWPGTFACGILYAGLVWWTNRRGDRKLGLGPVIWAHGLTNALLWGYVIYSGKWLFL